MPRRYLRYAVRLNSGVRHQKEKFVDTHWKQKQLAAFAANIASGVAVTAVVSPVLWFAEIPDFLDSPHKFFLSAYLVGISLIFFGLERKFLSATYPEHAR